MDIALDRIVATGAVALVFAGVFYFGGRVAELGKFARDPRRLVSFGAGMAAAYVIVHVMPELHGARKAFAESASTPLRYEGMSIYFVALVGFMVFYGLDHMRSRARLREGEEPLGMAFRIHVGGFAAYVWIMSYLLVRSLEDAPQSVALYGVAITAHFITIDHAMRVDHGAAYERVGRVLLAAMCVLGWAGGVLVPLPRTAIAPLVAFVGGAVIMNSTVLELPSEKDGRFIPFMIGGLSYGLILMPLG